MKTAVLLAALSALLILVGGLIGGQGGAMLFFVIALAMNVGSYWFSDKIVLRMYHAQPVGPDHPLFRMTQRLAQRASLPMPRVYIIPDQSPNAFATGRNPDHAAVAATEGIMRLLSESELEGVIAHELAHVSTATHSSAPWRRRSAPPSRCWRTWACFSAGRGAMTERVQIRSRSWPWRCLRPSPPG